MPVEFIIALIFSGLVLILCLLSLSKDFLTWGAKKMDPEWAKEYEEHLADFLRLKSQNPDSKWGS